ncbi:MAG: hypothetical protein ACJ764_13765 [Solirubrobacteraceae bacterium]
MVLARAWRRRLYASVGLTVIVPAALLVAVALLAANGGIPSLSLLTQTLSGPSAPAIAAPALGGAPSGASPVAGLVPAGRTASAGGTASAGPVGAVPVAAAPRPGGLAPAPAHGPAASPRGGDQSSGHLGPGQHPSHHSPQPPAHHSPQPSPHHSQPTVVDRVVNKVTPVTSSLPAPAGPIATQVVKSAGGLGDRVLHKIGK